MMPMSLTQTLKYLLVASFVSFLVQQTGDQFFGTHLLSIFGLTPNGFFSNHHYWQIFTYAFIHTDVVQLVFNLMILALVGSELERTWGRTQFLAYYFFCTAATGLIYLAASFAFVGGLPPLIGASGALYGLFTAYGLIFGERVLHFMMLFPMKAKHFTWILAGLQLMTAIYTPGGAVGGLIHLSGMATGFLYLLMRTKWVLIQRQRSRESVFARASSTKKKKPRHLKLVSSRSTELEAAEPGADDRPKTWH